MTRRRHRVDLGTVVRAAMRYWPDAFGRDPLLALDRFTAPLPAPAYFTPDEAAILASDAALRTPFGRLMAFLLFTGCRLREGVFAGWDRVEWEARTFAVIPPTEAERQAGVSRQAQRSLCRAVG